MKHTKVLLVLIIIFAGFLRLWQLGNVPISPDWDEVALGYNAFSILQTGRDEYGARFPVVLRSFNDYKPALYTYLIIPLIPIFDLTVFTVRLPSAIFGIITVLAVYFLIKELFKEKDLILANKHVSIDYFALLVALLLAISPWHLQFSRIAFESNVGLAFNVLLVLFFIKGLRKPNFLLFSVFCAALSIYTYQSEKVFTPLLLFGLIIIYRKQIHSISKKYLFFALVLGFIIMIPLINFTLTNKEAFARAKGVSIFSEKTTLLKADIGKLERDKQRNDLIGMVFDNRRIEYGKAIVSNYLSHFDVRWIFLTGDNEINRHHAPDMGLEYLVFLPFFFIGLYQLIFGKFKIETKIFICYWVLITAIPASITIGVPHSVRTLNFLPTLQIFTALGILAFFSYLPQVVILKRKIPVLPVTLCLSLVFFLFNFSYYLNQYFVQQNYEYAYDWQYGYKEVISYVKPIEHKYKKILVSNIGVMSQSYMFFLFYMKYDPKKYLSAGGTKSGNFDMQGNQFANFEFRKFDYYKEKGDVLFIGAPGDFPEVFKTIHEVFYPDHTLAIKVVEK